MQEEKKDSRTYSDRKEYMAAYYKDYYADETKKAAVLEGKRKLAERNRAAYKAWKETLSCTLCSERDACCLEFHHLDPAEKDYTLSKIAGKSMRFILKEAAKCIVLCSNCHKKVHAGSISLPSY